MHRWHLTLALGGLAIAAAAQAPRLMPPSVRPEPAAAQLEPLPQIPVTTGLPSVAPRTVAPREPEPTHLYDGRTFPSEPRRIPHRAKVYTQPPPGGPHQYEAVEASRRRDCPAATDAVDRGMAVSPDHAVLYKGAWLCFNEANQRPLATTVADAWADFVITVLPHLEGTPEQRQRQRALDPDLDRLPAWYRPPPSGLEYRLERFSFDDQLFDVVSDLFGEPKVTDSLARDLWYEATAAVGLSRISAEEVGDRPVIEAAWARRVYVLASALQSRSGRLLDAHWHEMLLELRAMLDEATRPRVGADGTEWQVPAQVLRARRVAEGDEPPPRLP